MCALTDVWWFVDYGLGNLLSVRRGLEHVGALVEISDDPSTISGAPRLVLPGVGAFSRGMKELATRGLDVALIEVTEHGTQLLGICLGMQLLFDSSLEFGPSEGLGLLAGRIEEIPGRNDRGESLKVPHVG
jgi:glutamine amidotransferase